MPGQAQVPVPPARPTDQRGLPLPPPDTSVKEQRLIREVLDPEMVFEVEPMKSRIVRTHRPITRIAVTNPDIVEVNEFSTDEIELIGKQTGSTTLSLWFEQPNAEPTVLRYLVRVQANQAVQERAEAEYSRLQRRLRELFPNSQVQLIPVGDKLIVRGQAHDAKEAADIMAVLGEDITEARGGSLGGGDGGGQPSGGNALVDAQGPTVINLLRVPGEQQVMLKVRVAEIVRDAARELGMDFNIQDGSFEISNFIGGAGNITAILDNGDVELFIRAFASHGYGKILAEPTLVAISGQPATFLVGGQFAVPTAVGVDGIGAASTTFQGFGTQLEFVPTVLDKDRIRLQVAPTLSSLNQDIAVGGIPGLDSRSVTTTVDLREGQWLAIAGLVQDKQGGRRDYIPLLGQLPIVGAAFSSQEVSRQETEMVILVSPELVHPCEPEQVPLDLPGTAVTDPTDHAFYLHLQLEGDVGIHHRSTIWPEYKAKLHKAHFAEWWTRHHVQRADDQPPMAPDYYIHGPSGFTD
jgi:pilus assembly protein CpaC